MKLRSKSRKPKNLKRMWGVWDEVLSKLSRDNRLIPLEVLKSVLRRRGISK